MMRPAPSPFAVGRHPGSPASNGWLYTASAQERFNGVIVGKSLNPLLGLAGGGGTVGDATALESALGRLQAAAGSPMNNAGVNLALVRHRPGTRDFYGNAIPADGAFDIGAHEAGTAVALQPPATPQASRPWPRNQHDLRVWQDVAGETAIRSSVPAPMASSRRSRCPS